MKNTSPKVDAYIEKSPGYARPILEKIRRVFHQTCPGIEETLKWGAPHFEYKGLVAGMAAFKKHVRFSFWKGGLIRDRHGFFAPGGKGTVGVLKLGSLSELPSEKILQDYIRQAIRLNEAGVKIPKPKASKPREPLEIPEDLAAALARSSKARATFEGFSYSHRKEYVEWITQAKQPATRLRRLKQAVEWMSEGKSRHWKYTRSGR